MDSREADDILLDYSADRHECDSFKFNFSFILLDAICFDGEMPDIKTERWMERVYLLRACRIIYDDGHGGYRLTLTDEAAEKVKRQIALKIEEIKERISGIKANIKRLNAEIGGGGRIG
jgi:hypothetical protein